MAFSVSMVKKNENIAVERLVRASNHVTIDVSKELFAKNKTMSSAYDRNRKFVEVNEKRWGTFKLP